jgi:hypothetical protein
VKKPEVAFSNIWILSVIQTVSMVGRKYSRHIDSLCRTSYRCRASSKYISSTIISFTGNEMLTYSFWLSNDKILNEHQNLKHFDKKNHRYSVICLLLVLHWPVRYIAMDWDHNRLQLLIYKHSQHDGAKVHE